MTTTITPIHPGEVLMEEFLEPLQVSQNRLAVAIGVPPRRINEIVHGKRRITADTALRLALLRHHRPLPAQLLQTRFDLEIEKDHLGSALDRIEPLEAVDFGGQRQLRAVVARWQTWSGSRPGRTSRRTRRRRPRPGPHRVPEGPPRRRPGRRGRWRRRAPAIARGRC